MPGSVMANGARHVLIEDCEIAHVGAYGLWFHRGCEDCTVRRCHFHDLGAGGVKIGDFTWNRPPKGPQQTGHITIDNCIIRRGGRIFPEGVGVLIGHSGDNTIEHNDISDLYYSAISVGWLWRYGPSPAERNRIAFNRLHHLGQGVLSDMGGVYTLGESPGTVVANNVVHDVYSYDYGGWGLYYDQASSQIVFEENLVYRTKSGGFHHHFGRDNLVQNNIFAYAIDPQLKHSRAEDHLAFVFEKNIVYYKQGDLMAGAWGDENVVLQQNIYWDASGRPVTFLGRSFDAWQALGKDDGSAVVDPRFVNPEAGNFDLHPDSPALELGFEPLDYEKAGVYGDPDWVALAEDYE
jgi:hypothetical protein